MAMGRPLRSSAGIRKNAPAPFDPVRGAGGIESIGYRAGVAKAPPPGRKFRNVIEYRS